MATVKVHDKTFSTSIPETQILESIATMAQQMNKDLAGQTPLFVCILNGAFMFASDLMKQIQIPCEITFVKVASYEGTSSSGEIKQLIGFNEQIAGRTVVILEDIIDTGNTIAALIEQVKALEPAQVKIATLLFKPDALKREVQIDYVGMEIPNEFIIGYGLDYNGHARNLKDIYTLVH